ncbi:unnamed protein product [Kluyveromyces dobzhanskii CBS 2104]|uniref:WGS project CCBQ000000000 data, contig 00058 n=1 Tax=Kluyveromyces dobzhanskii CBS 2104 TaxID=1427455 RepID=A0A0A8LBX0_9SACH|nr:unnamed protein product [Kluyveromyces dobzhanskii CBS 2104]
MKPQQLSNNVFFGPLNTLSQYDFLSQNDIKFFVSVGIPVERAMEYARNVQLDQFMLCCLDKDFDRVRYSDSAMCQILEFNNKHSTDLKTLIEHVSMSEEFNTQPLQSVLYRPVSEYTTNIYTAEGVHKFECFNDLITLFKLSKMGNILVFSSNGNDENLVTLLISQMLRQNPSISAMDAFNYVKNLRSTVNNLTEDKLYWCSGLVAYHERVKSKEMYGRPGFCGSTSNEVTNFATKRREQFEEEDMIDPDTSFGYANLSDAGNDAAESIASTPFSESDYSYSSDFQTPEPDNISVHSSRQYANPRLKRMALNK